MKIHISSRSSLVGLSMGIIIGVLLVVVVGATAPQTAFVEPSIRVLVGSAAKDIDHWTGTSSTVGPFVVGSEIIENRTGITSFIELTTWVTVAESPNGLNFILTENISGNISPNLRPPSVTFVVTDFPGNYSDGVLNAYLDANGGPPPGWKAVNISYPTPLGYNGTNHFTGMGELTDSVGFANQTGESRFHFLLPLFESVYVSQTNNTVSASNTFHLQAELEGFAQPVFCELTLDLSDTPP